MSVLKCLDYVGKKETITTEEMETEINKLKLLKDNLLPIEQLNKPLLEERILMLQFPEIFLEQPLKWRDAKGLPKLAVYTLDKPSMEFYMVGRRVIINNQKLKTIEHFYNDLSTKSNPSSTFLHMKNFILWMCCWPIVGGLGLLLKQSTLMYTALAMLGLGAFLKFILVIINMENSVPEMLRSEFDGFIPDVIKKQIKIVSSQFDDVWIIRKAMWTKTTLFNKDPLIIGVKNGKTYLINVFDVSQIENIIKSEFAI